MRKEAGMEQGQSLENPPYFMKIQCLLTSCRLEFAAGTCHYNLRNPVSSLKDLTGLSRKIRGIFSIQLQT